MTRFAYTAIPVHRQGAAALPAGTIRGRREAATAAALRDTLRREGLVPIRVAPVSPLDALRSRYASGRYRRGDALWFFQTLRLLLGGAVPMEQALGSMTELAGTPGLKLACESVREGVRGGASLADAVERCPAIASPQAVALLRAGHETGRLTHSVAIIESMMQRQSKLRRGAVSRLAYPAFLLLVALGVLWYLATFVIPRFDEVLRSLGGELPFATRVTLVGSKVVVWALPVAALAIVLGAAAALRSLSTKAKEAWSARVLHWPVIGALVWNGQAAMACDVIAAMVEGGGDVLAGMGQAESLVSSSALRRRLGAARQAVREGAEFGEAMTRHGVVPPVASAVVRVGLRSGDLVGSLKRAVEVCAEAQERSTQRLLVILEPLAVFLMALTVGWVVFSLVQGMMAINRLGTL